MTKSFRKTHSLCSSETFLVEDIEYDQNSEENHRNKTYNK